ncbi:MAG: hypothetical protein GX971_11890 [Firmicutes bacterium]|nr:hypothetical protein [Bacillota bacterium]
MVFVVALAYILVGSIEISLWSERPWKKLLVYVSLLTFAAVFSLLMMTTKRLPVPSLFGILGEWLKKLWP